MNMGPPRDMLVILSHKAQLPPMFRRHFTGSDVKLRENNVMSIGEKPRNFQTP
ncbi:hypothetical protein DPMN_121295 [Dreissena polymorpha]|uniref:Uncharacterized protein n=1 Tax=Dreissena polymorpha TaxID=45954 RepID=A0A9D4GLE7_DREPO|nr:hypothetical protein DPMN_121295 [Dreissena polymorpha]